MLGAMRVPGSAVLILVSLAGCAYQRYTTPLHVVPNPRLVSKDRPASLYTFRLDSGEVPPTKVSGLPWDDDGSGPDPFVKLFVDGRLVWKSEVKTDQTKPQWNVVLPNNVVIGNESVLRLEMWDWDSALTADPIGQLEHRGLPATASVLDAPARLNLESLGAVTITLSAPRPHKGVGVSVEARPDSLKVYAVEPYSPAARAGIRVGDQIVGVGNERVSHMGPDDAVSELALAIDRHHKLTIADADGKGEHQVQLDDGYVWLVM